MPTISSLDPRINRAGIPENPETAFIPKEQLDQFQTYEVFVQTKSGGHHNHVGSVHAPDPEIAMAFAKEQYCRRGQTFNIWVASTSSIYSLDVQDADIFETVPNKTYREVNDYINTREKIEAFKKSKQ